MRSWLYQRMYSATKASTSLRVCSSHFSGWTASVFILPKNPSAAAFVYGQINVYGVTTKSERHKRSYWTRTADGNGIGGRKAPVPYGS